MRRLTISIFLQQGQFVIIRHHSTACVLHFTGFEYI